MPLSNITTYRERPQFFRPIPKDYIMEVFDEAFKRTNLKGYDDQVTIEALCRVFREVGEWCTEHLRSGDFIYGIRHSVDQNRELFLWEYVIAGPNIPVRFLAHEAHLDTKRNYTITVRRCLQGIYHHLELADQKIAEFNRLVEEFKPKLPVFDQKRSLHNIMMHTQEGMKTYYRRKYGEDPTSYTLQSTAYEAWVLSDGIKRARGTTINDNCQLLFDVFEMTHVGWSQVKVFYKFRNLGMRFIILEEDINLYGEVKGQQIPSIVEGMLKTADASVRRWNWLVDGGHNKRSRVKNEFGTKRRKEAWDVWG